MGAADPRVGVLVQPSPSRERPSLAHPRIASWIERLRRNRAVRARVGKAGRLALDRSLPFLVVYRGPGTERDPGTADLLRGVAALGVAPPPGQGLRRFAATVRELAQASLADFGAYLLVEAWADEDLAGEPGEPAFRIHAARAHRLDEIVAELAEKLEAVRVADGSARVEIARGAWTPPAGELLAKRAPSGVTRIGLALRPVHRDPATGEPYPRVARELRRQLTNALQRCFYSFSCARTNACPRDYHMLGRRAMVRAVWEVDRQLAEVSDRFDFLIQVTPTNSAAAWDDFREQHFDVDPVFRYRPVPLDPAVLRRQVFAPAVEKVDDPTLDDLFRRKQAELDLQIGLLEAIGTRRFVLGGMQLYGEVEPPLLELARELVARCPVGRGRDDTTGGNVSEEELAELARAEIASYRAKWSGFAAEVTVRDDIARGLLVSQGSVLIGAGTRVPRRRVDALLQHEVGTHALTYHNARAQPLRLLSSGLDGYEALQEGLAVLAEYCAGGLSVARLRLLGARVLGVHAMLAGAGFVETFRLLAREHGFEERTAFNVALRIHRGGGLAKDAIYLRGLVQALDHVGSGGEIQPLAVGKIAPEHVALVRELQLRGVLHPAPLLPHYLERPESAERLARVRAGMSVLDLVDEAPF